MSVAIKLTEAGKKFMTDNYPQGIIYEYEPGGLFTLRSVGAEDVELLCPMGIPYRLPHKVEGEQTWRKSLKFTVLFSLEGSVTVEAGDIDEVSDKVGDIDLTQHINTTKIDHIQEQEVKADG